MKCVYMSQNILRRIPHLKIIERNRRLVV